MAGGLLIHAGLGNTHGAPAENDVTSLDMAPAASYSKLSTAPFGENVHCTRTGMAGERRDGNGRDGGQ